MLCCAVLCCAVQLIKTYNNKATDMMFAAGDLEEELQQPTLYQSVGEVQTAISDLNASLRQVCPQTPAALPILSACVCPVFPCLPAGVRALSKHTWAGFAVGAVRSQGSTHVRFHAHLLPLRAWTPSVGAPAPPRGALRPPPPVVRGLPFPRWQSMTNLTLQYNDIAANAEQLQQFGSEEAFSRYSIAALFERHEAVAAKLAAREEALQV